MRACLRQGGFSQVATIREKSRVGGGDQAVNEVNSLVTVTVASGTARFVKSCSTSGALGSQASPCTWGLPRCCHSKRSEYTSLVEVLQELLKPLTKEPVSNGRILDHSTTTSTSVVWVVRTDQVLALATGDLRH